MDKVKMSDDDILEILFNKTKTKDEQQENRCSNYNVTKN